MACALLRDAKLCEGDANIICKIAGERAEWPLLRLAAMKASVASVDSILTHVLPQLDSPYWQSRAMEGIIDRTSDTRLLQLAADYPLAFLWAIARRGDKHLLPHAALLIVDVSWYWLPVIAWALGELAATSELDALEDRLRRSEIWTSYLEHTGGAAPHFLQAPSSLWPPWNALIEKGSRHAVQQNDSPAH